MVWFGTFLRFADMFAHVAPDQTTSLHAIFSSKYSKKDDAESDHKLVFYLSD